MNLTSKAMAKNRFYTIMVIGDNPDELMEKYSLGKKVEPYIKYKYLDAKKIKEQSLSMYGELIKNAQKYNIDHDALSAIEEKYNSIKAMSPFEYYVLITSGMYYDENGNAMSDENPNGKWSKYHVGQGYSYPLVLKNGTEAYSAKKSDIKWDDMHLNKTYVNLFNKIWSLCVDDEAPETDDDKKIKSSWGTRKKYLENFKSKDDFVSHNCSYWNYAYLDEKGWVDLDDSVDDKEWVSTFYDKFVVPLPDDAVITIYEYMIDDI